MTAIELYQFITQNGIEWREEDNNGTQDILIFPFIGQLQEFCNLLKPNFISSPIECRLCDGYFAIWMNDICNYYGIDIKEVFIGN